MRDPSESEHSSLDVEAAAYGHQANPLSLEKTASQAYQPNINPLATHKSRISRVLSHVRTADSIPLAPPPDGGARAWITACLTSLVIFNTWGFVNSFGVFQTYYVSEMQIGSNSSVSWIGSMQVFLVFGIGTFSGRAVDAGFFKLVFWSGSVLYLLGMFMLSLCTAYWQVFLAQAIAVGIGNGMVFVPAIALTSSYFSAAKRGPALAIAVAGSSIGGLVFPAIAQQMLPKVGFGWTIRTMAFVQLATALLCGTFMKVSHPCCNIHKLALTYHSSHDYLHARLDRLLNGPPSESYHTLSTSFRDISFSCPSISDSTISVALVGTSWALPNRQASTCCLSSMESVSLDASCHVCLPGKP